MKILPILFFVCVSWTIQAQTYVRNFEARASDAQVGKVKTTKITDGTIIQYHVDSEINIHVLFIVNITYKAQASYNEGVLVSSSASVFINGHLHNSVVTEKVDSCYTVVENEHSTKLYEEIKFSTAKMYFTKPVGQSKVYSESEGIMKPMVETSEGKYTVKDPKNSDNITVYGYSSEQGLNDIVISRIHLPDVKIKQVREVIPEEE
jgi:hypothetical protein